MQPTKSLLWFPSRRRNPSQGDLCSLHCTSGGRRLPYGSHPQGPKCFWTTAEPLVMPQSLFCPWHCLWCPWVKHTWPWPCLWVSCASAFGELLLCFDVFSHTDVTSVSTPLEKLPHGRPLMAVSAPSHWWSVSYPVTLTLPICSNEDRCVLAMSFCQHRFALSVPVKSTWKACSFDVQYQGAQITGKEEPVGLKRGGSQAPLQHQQAQASSHGQQKQSLFFLNLCHLSGSGSGVPAAKPTFFPSHCKWVPRASWHFLSWC